MLIFYQIPLMHSRIGSGIQNLVFSNVKNNLLRHFYKLIFSPLRGAQTIQFLLDISVVLSKILVFSFFSKTTTNATSNVFIKGISIPLKIVIKALRILLERTKLVTIPLKIRRLQYVWYKRVKMDVPKLLDFSFIEFRNPYLSATYCTDTLC